MLDAIRLSKAQTAVVTLGIDSESSKPIWDFAPGRGCWAAAKTCKYGEY
ncbi:hypothetical protein SAMN06265222_1122 [Neorhodopirellula lusitana]|uniref:Uncharacterized protein n=1 Tax=Neorhodopirellula lusitana TaxID=445327 RepID=A0ABY1QI54_9BACT|nr:hypothetical protein SAMN06265222_1122 [Neorhodopirellula lusitana]